MEEKVSMKSMRRTLAPMSRTLLVYFLMMNLVVLLVDGLDASFRILWGREPISFSEALQDAMATNYWGYLVCIAIGLAIVLGWKGSAFWRQEIWKTNREMTLVTFLLLGSWLYAMQMVFGYLNAGLERVLEQWGASSQTALESATALSLSPSMFLYACVAGPIAEELLFRGLILRSFLPYGKKFAVAASALLFGFYHGNPVQTPVTFAVGLIFGYAAVEYNIGWAMVLHMGNNLLLCDTLVRVLGHMHPLLAGLLEAGIALSLLLCWIVTTLIKRRGILTWLRREKMNWRAMGALFQCPSTIVLVCITVGCMVLLVL